jgi:hypothetical protein
MMAEMDSVKKNVAHQYAMADYLADHAAPESQAYMHEAATTAKQHIGSIM